MKADQPLAIQPYRDVLRLNAIAWALLAAGGVNVFLLFDRPAGIEPPLLLLMPVVAGLGAAINLLLVLLSLWRGKQKIAGLYLSRSFAFSYMLARAILVGRNLPGLR
jgi:hypothetical protein